MMPMKDRQSNYRRIYRLQGVALAIVLAALLLGAQALVADPVAPEPQFDACRNALPVDEGEVVLNRLERDGNGGLRLNSERHQVVGYAMTHVPVVVD